MWKSLKTCPSCIIIAVKYTGQRNIIFQFPMTVGQLTELFNPQKWAIMHNAHCHKVKIITVQCAAMCTVDEWCRGIIGKVGVASCTHALVVRCSILSHSTPVSAMYIICATLCMWTHALAIWVSFWRAGKNGCFVSLFFTESLRAAKLYKI